MVRQGKGSYTALLCATDQRMQKHVQPKDCSNTVQTVLRVDVPVFFPFSPFHKPFCTVLRSLMQSQQQSDSLAK